MMSLGSIGGADGPTVVITTGSPVPLALLVIAVVIAAAVGLGWILHKR